MNWCALKDAIRKTEPGKKGASWGVAELIKTERNYRGAAGIVDLDGNEGRAGSLTIRIYAHVDAGVDDENVGKFAKWYGFQLLKRQESHMLMKDVTMKLDGKREWTPTDVFNYAMAMIDVEREMLIALSITMLKTKVAQDAAKALVHLAAGNISLAREIIARIVS